MELIKKQEEVKRIEDGQEVTEIVEKEYISISQPATLIDRTEYVQDLQNKIADDQKEIDRRTQSKMKLEAELEKIVLLDNK